jgi:hypothetical protein
MLRSRFIAWFDIEGFSAANIPRKMFLAALFLMAHKLTGFWSFNMFFVLLVNGRDAKTCKRSC